MRTFYQNKYSGEVVEALKVRGKNIEVGHATLWFYMPREPRIIIDLPQIIRLLPLQQFQNNWAKLLFPKKS